MPSNRSTLSLKPIESRRAFEEILDQLEQAILAGELSIGDTLPPEREMATQFAVSRTSVREAVRVLETLGLVDVRRGAERGATLREEPGNVFGDVLRFLVALGHLSQETVLDFRLVLQVWAAGQVAEQREEHSLSVLRGLVERMEADPLDPSQFRSVDVEFHLAIVHACQNELATMVTEAIRHSVEQLVLDTFQRETDWDSLREQLTREHRAILNAIEGGEVEASKRLVEDHIRGFWNRRLDATRSLGDGVAGS
jgi:GntR family transcriptional repressor for pyruvate dehydrogenase complex